MKFVLFRPKGLTTAPLRIGALHPNGADVADVSASLADGGHPLLSSMRAFLELGPRGRAAAAAALESPVYHRSLALVDLRAPIYDPCVVLFCPPPPRPFIFAWRAASPLTHTHARARTITHPRTRTGRSLFA